MFEILSSFGWVSGFTFCTMFHLLFERFRFDNNKSNIVTCILFQTTFVFTSYLNISNELLCYFKTSNCNKEYLKFLTIQNVSFIYGYFLYDLANMLLHDYPIKKEYVIHHIISIMIIDNSISIGIGVTDMLLINIMSFLIEFTSPFINLRILIKHNIRLKTINKKIIKLCYFICRIVLYPFICVLFLININYYNKIELYVNISFIAYSIFIYTFSFMWYSKMTKTINQQV